ncbi:hypothetical protein E4T56_gene13963, partial [Termitomyces sp. T112]
MDSVIPRHAAAAQSGKADRAGLARAGDAVAPAHGHVGQADLAPARGGLAQQQRRARGRVHLHAVMGLDDLDVPILAEALGRFLDQKGQHVDAQRRIAGLQHGDFVGGLIQQPVVAFLKAGGTDKDRHASGNGRVQIAFKRGGRGKVDQHLRGSGQRRDIFVPIHATCQFVARIRDGLCQRAAHAPGAADNSQSGHGESQCESQRPKSQLPEHAIVIDGDRRRRTFAQPLQQVDLDRAAHRVERQVVARIGKGIDQIVANRQHRHEHHPGHGRAERRCRAERLDQTKGQQHAEQMGEIGGKQPELRGQGRVLQPLHPALGIGDIDQNPFDLGLLDGVDDALRAGLRDLRAGGVQQRVGGIGARQGGLGIGGRDIGQRVARHRQATQLVAQRIYIGDLAQHDGAGHGLPLRPGHEIA